MGPPRCCIKFKLQKLPMQVSQVLKTQVNVSPSFDVIGLHAVHFGNSWTKKIPRTATAIGPVTNGCQRNFRI